jgi:hypothetical protein
VILRIQGWAMAIRFTPNTDEPADDAFPLRLSLVTEADLVQLFITRATVPAVDKALVLNHFCQPTHIFGIFGGFTGKYIVDEITNQKIAITPAWVNAPTRINVFINDGQQEYKLVNPGTWVDDDCKQQIVDNLSRIEAGDTLVISGSLPPGIESRFYAEILTLCKQKGCEVILDISHPVLRNLVEMQPLYRCICCAFAHSTRR